MKKAILILFWTAHIFLHAESEKIFELDMVFKTYGVSVDSREIEATYLGQQVGFETSYQFAPNLVSYLNASINFETGSHNAQFTDIFLPSQFVALREGVFRWQALKFLRINAGAVSQQIIDMPLLVRTGVAFAGAQEFLTFQPHKNIELELLLTQSIPNNHVLAQRLANISEGTPYFYAETLTARVSNDIKDTKLTVTAGHYSFKNLSTGVANQSRFLGNTVTGTTNINSQFSYNFDGFFAIIKPSYQYKNYTISPSYRHLFNNSAPNGRNNGYIAELEVQYQNEKVKISPRIFKFRNESDTSPGFYNSQWFANNNRQGTGVAVSGYFAKYDFELEASAITAKPIETNLFQNQQKLFTLSITKPFNIL